MKKIISILGSTGSVGLNALRIVEKRKNLFKFNLLSANKNYSLICKQIKKYNPSIFVISDKKIFAKIKYKFRKKNIKILNNYNNLKLNKISHITISAIPGIAGLQPTIMMIEKSKKLLIANKESIICGWNLIEKLSKKNKTKIIPVDSEHFSIFELLKNHKIKDIKKIYITASGGPFLNYSPNQLKRIKPDEALKHPKWTMGKKISIDSSTLMNKILELIEAQKLFNLKITSLDILIHPESLVHAIVEFKNGLTKFIYHDTSMIIPLANAIFDGFLNIENFYKSKKKMTNDLSFKKVNPNLFPVIKIKNRLDEFPSTPIIINAVNEILVDQFLQKKIRFSDINKIIMTVLKDRNYRKYAIRKPVNIKVIQLINDWAKELTLKKYVKKN